MLKLRGLFGTPRLRLRALVYAQRCRLAVVLLTAVFLVKNVRWRVWGRVVIGKTDWVMPYEVLFVL